MSSASRMCRSCAVTKLGTKASGFTAGSPPAGLRVLVIDPSSLLVNRRAKRAKTDRIDAKAMIRALMAYNRGEDQVLSAVNVPSVEQEDQRRLVRERQSLVYDCTAHTNRIRGLLLTQGIVGFDPRASGAERQLDELVTGDGRSLGPRLKDEMRREIGRLRVVLEQLKDVSAERNAIALGKTIETLHRDQGSADADAAMIASLARIKGVGPNDASVLVREAFWRKFNNRRELAAWSGLAPMALGERNSQPGPGHRKDRSRHLPLAHAADRLALASSSAAKQAVPVVQRADERGGRSSPAGHNRGARTQAPRCALALCDDRPCADRRHHRLSSPDPLRPTGENREDV